MQCIDELQPKSAVLPHVGHTLDAWLMGHRGELPANVGGCSDQVC
ncbi:hypothetical protein [Pseudomonas sp. IT-P4]